MKKKKCGGDIVAKSAFSPAPAGGGDVRREPEIPKLIRVDYRTSFEQFLLGLAACLALVAFASFILISIGLSSGDHPLFPAKSLSVPLFFFALAALVFYLYKNADNHYILDTEKRAIFYRFKLFSYEETGLRYSFSDIAAAAVYGVMHSNKHSKTWRYAMCLVGRDGGVIEMDDFAAGETGRAEKNEKAGKIAAIVGCEFAECPPHSHFRVETRLAGAPQIVFVAGGSFAGAFKGCFMTALMFSIAGALITAALVGAYFLFR